MSALRVLSVGLGPIGLEAARLALAGRSLELVGAVDLDPEKAGRDLAELLGLDEATGLRVERDLAAALARARPDVAILCTGSTVPAVLADVERIVRAGAGVVSSCEELLWPALQHPELARRLDAAARSGGSAILGTGVNPGFVLDFLPVVLSGVSRRVERVRGVRILDAAARRLPLQKKVGAGLAVEEFRRLVAAGRLGHVGMRESVALVGHALGFDLDEVTQTVEPVVAERRIETAHLVVEPGRAAGIRNLGFGRSGGETRVELVLEMYVGAPDPRDEIFLEGDPPLHLAIEGGTPGDAATAAILVNSLAGVAAAPPGLKTVLDLPPPRLAR